MPNWCTTTFAFKGEPKEIAALYALIEKSTERTKEHLESSGFNADWLGNILIEAGLGDLIDKPHEDGGVSCRGSIMDVEELEECSGYSTFNLVAETAWVPMPKMWDVIIKKLQLDSVQFCYEAEECGCGIYQIYDPYELGYFDDDQVYIDVVEDTEASRVLVGYYTLDGFIDTALDFLEVTEQKTDMDTRAYAEHLANMLIDRTKDEEGHPALAVNFFTYVQDMFD